MTKQVHCIPYYIHYKPQKHPHSLLEESSMTQKIYRTFGQYFKKYAALCQSIPTYLVYGALGMSTQLIISIIFLNVWSWVRILCRIGIEKRKKIEF